MSLPATIGSSLASNPFPLGLAQVTAAGTAVNLTVNFTDAAERPARNLVIQALLTNAKKIYVIISSLQPPWTMPGADAQINGADTTNFLNVIFELAPGQIWEVPPQYGNRLLLGQFWIDADQNNDGAIASIFEN